MAISYTVSYTFSPSTTISSSQVNTNFSDNSSTWQGIEAKTKTFSNLGVDTQLKSGGTVETANGAVGAPSFTFSSDTATGFYRNASTVIGVGTGNKITGIAVATGATDVPAYSQLKVLQVVTATFAAQTNTTSSTFQACTNALVSITPTSASNRVLIISTGVFLNITAGNVAILTIKRGATELSGVAGGFTRNDTTSMYVPYAICYIDSPATTSATTYQVFIASTNNVNTVQFHRSDTTGTITVMEVV